MAEAGKEQHEKKNKVVSVTFSLDPDNVAWLWKVNEDSGRKSVSNTLNFMLDNLRLRKNMGMKYD